MNLGYSLARSARSRPSPPSQYNPGYSFVYVLRLGKSVSANCIATKIKISRFPKKCQPFFFRKITHAPHISNYAYKNSFPGKPLWVLPIIVERTPCNDWRDKSQQVKFPQGCSLFLHKLVLVVLFYQCIFKQVYSFSQFSPLGALRMSRNVPRVT